MGKNSSFGIRVKRQRELVGADRRLLADWADIDLRRLKLIKLGQMDQSDLTDEQLSRLASALRCSSEWLTEGVQPGQQAAPTAVIAQRSYGAPVQSLISFGPDTCSRCGEPVIGPRCSRCGHPSV